jgi:hypothetical protein
VREHRQFAGGCVRPFFFGTIPIKFHAVAVRIAQVKRLAHAMIRRAVQFNSRREHAPQCIRQRRARWIKNAR